MAGLASVRELVDVISHAAWGAALFRGRVRWWAAAAVGALPDLIAFLPARIQELARGNPNLLHEPRPLSDYPAFTFRLYDFSHSIFGTALVAIGVWLVLRSSPALRRRLAASDEARPRAASRCG